MPLNPYFKNSKSVKIIDVHIIILATGGCVFKRVACAQLPYSKRRCSNSSSEHNLNIACDKRRRKCPRNESYA